MKKLIVKLAVILYILLLVSIAFSCAAPAPEPLTLTPEEEILQAICPNVLTTYKIQLINRVICVVFYYC